MKLQKVHINEVFYKRLFVVISLALTVLMPILSFDYGVTVDEEFHNDSGKSILQYFEGTDSTAALSPFDENGVWIGDWQTKKEALNVYGSFFDLICVSTYKYFFKDSVGEYEYRHIINSLFGVLLFIFIGLIAQKLGGWKVGVMALIFAFLTPRLFGHAMNNPKDFPLAAMTTFTLYYMLSFLQKLPKISFVNAFMVSLGIAFSIAFRAGGLILISYICLFIFYYWILEILRRKKFTSDTFKYGLKLCLIAIAISFLGYLGCALVWPYAQSNPLLAPYLSLKFFSDVASFNSFELFDGNWINYWEIPWYFIPKWFLITFPLHLIFGIVAFPLLYLQKRLKIAKPLNIHFINILLFAAVAPVLYVIFNESNVYDDGRHLLFCVPPIIVLCALSWHTLIGVLRKSIYKYIAYGAILVLLFQPMRWMIKNHPFQVVYFNPLVGGNEGAFKTYVIDFWGYSIKAAVEWMDENLEPETPGNPIRVRLGYGTQFQSKYYLDKTDKLQHVVAHEESLGWDYSLIFPVQSKFDFDLIANWPPKGTVHEIKADNAPLCAVVKNSYTRDNMNLAAMEREVLANPSVNSLINLTLEYFNVGNFNRGILLTKYALQLDSSNVTSLNNLCYAFNELKMYHEAVYYGEKALAIDPNFELVKGNLNVSTQGLASQNEIGLSNEDYINFSLNYYSQNDFHKCIEYCEKVLETDPDSYVAYNNICSSYNALGNYELAKQACTKAIEIYPDFELAKNNLKHANEQLKNSK